MDVAPGALGQIPWQSAAVPAGSEDMFAVGVSSTTAMAGNDDNWADFGTAATTAKSSEDNESGWADFASFDSAQAPSTG